MIYVSEELKQAFLSAEQKNLLLTFDDGIVIDNDDIALESMGLEQTLCDSDELRFGKISSACFKTKIKASTKRYKNLWFNASISVGNHTIQLGRFKVYTDNMTSDRLYREIVAYDSLFWAINTDITEWYNGLTFPITQKAFRDSLFAYLGIEQEEVELPNDNITFNRTVNVENLTGLTVLQKLCEINATWGTINNLGKFKYVRMRTHEHDALYPSDDLFPSDDLYPNDIYDDRLSKASYFQGSLKYEEYDTQPITKVTIREDADDLGYSYGNNGNTYVIEDNLLLYGANDTTLQTVAKNFYDYAQYIAYTPSELKCKGIPWREVGDLLLVVADKRTLTIPILNRQLSGITALKDTYIAKGTETYGEVKNSPTEQLKKLQRRTNRLTRTLDETKSEISKVETETKEYANNVAKNAENNANNSTNEKLKSYSTTKEMNSAITQKANEINFSVDGKITETKTYAENVSTTAETNANNHTNEKLKDYSTTTQSNAYADKVAESAKNSANANTAEKLKIYSTTTEMNTAIQQKVDSITLSVDKKVTETKVYADSVSANAENNAKASTDEKLKSYSTTTEMNAAIQQKADSITSAVSKTYATQTTVNNLQQQIDGAIETFTGSFVPTLKNAPANSWTTNAIKDTHIGDLYVVNSSGGNYAGFYYRFEKSGSTYQWTLLKDNEVTKALQEAKEANEKANAVADDLSTNYSTTVEMNSAIEQKADSITSTVAKSQDTWIIDIESYSIDIYGYGNPANAMAAENKGKTYLDMETGFVYQTITNGQGQIVWTIVGECQKRTDDIYSKIQQNAYGISQKVSNGEVVSEINQSAEEILLKGNRVVIESTNFELTKDGSILIKSGTIDVKGSVTKYASDYTKEDVDRANRITIGLVQPTVYDYEKLDLNGDGVIDTLDSVIITKLVRGELSEYTVDTSVSISPLSKTNIIQTQGVAIGVKGIYSENGIHKDAMANKFWAMVENLGYRPGQTGTFTSADGKTITVTGGIITSIL